MGGNALKLKGLEPKRIPEEEIDTLIKSISNTLIEEKIFKWILPAKSYKQKKDHGDLDLIGEIKNSKDPWHLKAKLALNSKEIHWNKPVASLEYKGYQIDLTGRDCHIKAKTHLEYSHYSPFGNILGRIIRKTGAKWGINGLEYEIKETDNPQSHILKTISLTNNIDEILKFCGLNPKIWHQGFNCQEDIFSYTCQSPLFSKEIFLLENLNHTHRKRDRTRPDYHNWLKYIENKEIKNQTQWKINPSPENYQEKIKKYQEIINEKFPNSKVLETLHTERENNNFVKAQKEEKFNGHLIGKWTNLQGAELGNFIKEFKKFQGITSKEALINWIYSKDKKFIKDSILDFKKTIEDTNIN